MLVVLGWVGLGHTKWTHGQLCCGAFDNELFYAASHSSHMRPIATIVMKYIAWPKSVSVGYTGKPSKTTVYRQKIEMPFGDKLAWDQRTERGGTLASPGDYNEMNCTAATTRAVVTITAARLQPVDFYLGYFYAVKQSSEMTHSVICHSDL